MKHPANSRVFFQSKAKLLVVAVTVGLVSLVGCHSYGGRRDPGELNDNLLTEVSCLKPNGSVLWFNDSKGFGFITPDDGGDQLFVHFSSLLVKGFKTLKEGQRVCFDVTQGPKGKQAANVSVFDSHSPTSESK